MCIHGGAARPATARDRAAVVAAALAVASCGGDSSTAPATGTFLPESVFAAQCAAPRAGTDPATGLAYPDQPGSVLTENNWLRSWTHDTYLWYLDVADADPASYASPSAYFPVLKSTGLDAAGEAKDRFHFTYATSVWEGLSQSGLQAGYGASWILLAASPPRDVRIAYTAPGSPAAAPSAALSRGARVLAIDGVDMTSGSDVATLNAGLYPTAGSSHRFTILDSGATAPRTVALVAQDLVETPVPTVSTFAGAAGGIVGYVLFNDHIATAESELVAAFTRLRQAAVSDLVLDIRYNGGGYLDIASEVAYMIAGGVTQGRTFELQQFNDRHPTINPVTLRPIAPTPFHATSLGYSTPAGQPLPTLGLARVFVLTGATTCSASEAIINGLRGVGVQVIQVGSTTCGKPYGFYPTDNCGTTYFTIQFRGVNAAGFGAYPEGFTPQNATSGTMGVPLPGCAVADDFSHPLGDPAESRLAAALALQAGGACPAPTALSARLLRGRWLADGIVAKSPWQENRILDR
ncbi:MAG TPA: S41 family peptidase [Burkholderiaceae bacterium]|nr:S41 family peptidase [Burkholderiaceae bacterium]